MLMCRKVLCVYDFPLHHISNIRIFHLIVFWSIRKQWVLKDIYTRLLVIIIGSISWSSKSVRILWRSIALHIHWYILCFCGTQGHRALLPAASGNHGKTPRWNNNPMCSSGPLYSLPNLYRHIPANSSSYWRHIPGHIQLCLIYISVHALLLSI